MFKTSTIIKSLAVAVASLVAVTTNAAFAEDIVPSSKTENVSLQASILKAGTFKGLSKHETTGGISIINTGNGYIAILESNFSLDGAPAPTLGFGNDGKFDPATEFTPLQSIKGAQAYVIPATIDPAQFSEFYVWCADFTVPLGVAKLK